jgi:hypothetical protein
MNRFFLILILFVNVSLTKIGKHAIDYRVDLKNRIIVNSINQAYYSSNKLCSLEYVKPKIITKGLNYTDHTNSTNITKNKLYIKYNRSN